MTGGVRLTRRTVTAGTVLLTWFLFGSAALAADSGRIVRKKLASGLPLIFERDSSSQLTSLTLLIRGGQRAEQRGQAGLAFLVTRLLLEIPDSRSAQMLMGQASTAGLDVQGDYSLITIESLSRNFEDTLRIMSGPLLDPLFSGLRIDNTTRSMLHRRSLAADDPARMGHEVLVSSLFGGSAYGNPVLGSEETLKALKGRRVSEFYKSWFRADNVLLSVISDLEADAVAAIIDKFFKKFPGGASPELPSLVLEPLPSGPQRSFVERQTTQTLISWGFRLPGTTPRSYALAALVETLLGKGPGSRLWPLRYELKLAYNIDANAAPEKDAGMLEVFLETDEARRDAAASALEKALLELRSGEVSPAELDAAKTMAKANFLRDNETKDRRSPDLAIWECLGLGAEYLDKFPAEVEAISAVEFQAYLREVLDPSRAKLVVVGPKDISPSLPEEER